MFSSEVCRSLIIRILEQQVTVIPIQNKINSYQHFAAEYGDLNLTNHLPMAQFAMFRMGANDADFNRFSNHYICLHDLPPVGSTTGIRLRDDNWQDYLGTRKYFADYRLFFGEQLNKLGRKRYLGVYFNSLVGGISSAAFHSLIRLAYGVDSENDEEILSGEPTMRPRARSNRPSFDDSMITGVARKRAFFLISAQV